MKELYSALSSVSFPPIARSKTVSVRTKTGGTYTFAYAPLEAILEAIRPRLGVVGISILQTIQDSCVLTTLAHKSGESLTLAPVRINAQEGCTAQEYGSALTYARRYSLTVALNLATEDDDDGNAASGNEAKVISLPDRTKAMKVANSINEHFVNDRELGAYQEWEIVRDDHDLAQLVWSQIPTANRDKIRKLSNEAKK